MTRCQIGMFLNIFVSTGLGGVGKGGGFVQLESELPVTSVAKTSNACGLSPFLGPSTKRIVNLLWLMYLLQLVISSDSVHSCASSADVCVTNKINIRASIRGNR